MRTWVFTAILTVLGAAAYGGAMPANADPGTDVNGDVIRTDTTWSVSGSPYRIHDTVQIAQGATLTIGPGVQIVSGTTKSLFLLAGNITLSGSAGAQVTVNGAGSEAIFALVGKDVDRVGLTVNHARLSSAGGFLKTSGYAVHIQLTLSDSTLMDLPAYNYIWYPLDSTISRNVFVNSGGFSVGTDRSSTVRFESNRFQTASTTGYWIENWVAYGTAMQVHGNAFMAAGTPTVALKPGYSPVGIDASGNYWGTTDQGVIRQMVLDENTSIDRTGIITVNPVLTEVPSGVPAPVALRPGPPTGVNATPGNAEATVAWLAPANTGGAPITGYTVTSTPDARTCATAGDLTCTVTGLTNGVSYTFSVSAIGPGGTSASSSPSPPVTPRAPVSLPGAVTNLKATPAKGSIRVAWSPPSNLGGATSVTYQYQVGNKAWKSTSAPSVTVRGKKGVRIAVNVRAVNSAGLGPSVSVSGVPR